MAGFGSVGTPDIAISTSRPALFLFVPLDVCHCDGNIAGGGRGGFIAQSFQNQLSFIEIHSLSLPLFLPSFHVKRSTVRYVEIFLIYLTRARVVRGYSSCWPPPRWGIDIPWRVTSGFHNDIDARFILIAPIKCRLTRFVLKT